MRSNRKLISCLNAQCMMIWGRNMFTNTLTARKLSQSWNYWLNLYNRWSSILPCLHFTDSKEDQKDIASRKLGNLGLDEEESFIFEQSDDSLLTKASENEEDLNLLSSLS